MSSPYSDYATRRSHRSTSSGADYGSRPTPPSIDGSGDGTSTSSTDSYASRRHSRPTPPAVDPGSYDRPVPPPVSRPVPLPVDRPVPPPVDPGSYDRPVPPPVHVPRYYWQPSYPVLLPSNPEPIPQIPLPPSPAPARKVDKSEVSNDVVDLLAGYGRLRGKGSFLFVTTHPKLDTQHAKDALKQNQTIYLAPDGGIHESKTYQPITSLDQLQPLLPKVQDQKLGDLQNQENQAYQARVNQWVDQDVQHRINNLPAFNSIYDMNRLNLDNMLVTEGGRSFNRNLITAMNVYQQYDVKQEIAQKWHENPNMGTGDFNRMANSVISQHVSNLYWDANFMGDYGTYLGSNPVPGLRYPDTQEDIDWNTRTIQRVASEVPMLLNGAVQY